MAKRALFVTLLLGLLVPLFAVESDYFVKTVLIDRIYPHSEGYVVIYTKSSVEAGEIYLPHDWFYESGGKGELVLGDDPVYPYFSVFYLNGEFSHLRLYIQRDYNHPSWGSLRNPDAYNGRFSDDFTIDY